ncbi:nucleic acid-binding protein [Pyricularia oryzae]|nr:nucleic acid-binding protein [Pyricularia oryzae]
MRAVSAQTARTAIVSKRVVPVLAAVPASIARSTALPIARAFSVSRTLANVEENSGSSLPRQEQPNGIFVRNLVFDATNEHLAEAFSQYGNVVDAKVARDARGFGFIYFETPEAAQKACEEANNTFWHGRRINVAPRIKASKPGNRDAMNQEERTPTSSLYIGNIPYESTDAALNNLFQDLEGLKDVRIAVDRSTGWPRGFAHADFKDVESATKAVEKVKLMELMGRTLRVDYSTPRVPRNERMQTASGSRDSRDSRDSRGSGDF